MANRPFMFNAAVSLPPLVSPKPLHQLDPDEEKEVAERATRFARVVAHADIGDD